MLAADMTTMTGNVAQVFVDDGAWIAALEGIRGALRSSGRLVFEVLDVRDAPERPGLELVFVAAPRGDRSPL